MKKLISVCVLGLAAATAAHATPQVDDMEKFLSQHNVLSQIQQASSNVRSSASELVSNAMGFLGVRYRYGGTSPETGFDCSGFVRATFEKTIGRILPRRASDQAAAGQPISRDELKPGDLVFFNTMRRTFSHVGIYIGEGKFIHSPRTGSTVRVDSMDASYWTSRFDGARRMVEGENAPSASEVQALKSALNEGGR